MSFVYFIRPIGMAGPIKIGCSKGPKTRLSDLMAWSPFELELIASVPGDMRLERNVHECFADLHSHGEWFKATRKLSVAIEKIAKGTPIEKAIDLTARVGKHPRRKRGTLHPRNRSQSIQRLIIKAGGTGAVARACGITSQAVSQWVEVPPHHVKVVSRMSGVLPHRIRPDIFDRPERRAS